MCVEPLCSAGGGVAVVLVVVENKTQLCFMDAADLLLNDFSTKRTKLHMVLKPCI